MSEKLAIDGGQPALTEAMRGRVPKWPVVNGATAERLKEVYLSAEWSFNGAYEQQFGAEFARYHGADRGVLMVNGTVTLECALAALGVGPGDEVIVPALTWMATAMAVLYVGATPVFVDIEPDTLCLDPAKTARAITPKTKAIIPVHLYGSMADMEALGDLARRKGLAIIEDCAHAHGGVWAGRGVGSIGQVGSFSFQQSKTLTCGEAGACITSDAVLAERLYRLKHIGYDLGSAQGKAQSSPPAGLICHNYRATEFQALILLDGLKDLRAQTEKREASAAYLRELTAEISGVEVQARGRRADVQGYYVLMFLFDLKQFGGVSLGRVMEVLQAEGIGIGGTYGPVYRHALWNVGSSGYRIAEGGCPVCEEACANRGAGMLHHWLLGDRELMEGIAKGIMKAQHQLSRNAE